MGWYYILYVLCERNVKPQAGSFCCAKCESKTNLSIPKLEALTLTIYSPKIYNIYLTITTIYIQLHTTSDTGFKLKFLMQLTKQIL